MDVLSTPCSKRITPPMTRKHLPCGAVQCCCRESCINRRILNIGMPHAILHKRQISAGVEEMRCNRMLQAMELSLLHRQACGLSILLPQLPKHKPTNRHIAIRHKETMLGSTSQHVAQ